MESLKLQTVERALIALEMIAERPLTHKEIEREMGLNRTTTRRLLSSLQRRNYIEKDPVTNQYKVGLTVVELASNKLNRLELKTESAPLLQELSMALNQVCHMAVLVDGEVIYINKVQPQGAIKLFSYIGRSVPIHSTALGKVLASDLSNEQILNILDKKGMKQITELTLQNSDSYLEEIERVRIFGFAIDHGENEVGVRCIAAPVRDYRNQVIAAISTSSSFQSPLPGYNSATIDKVKACALQISKQMGFQAYKK